MKEKPDDDAVPMDTDTPVDMPGDDLSLAPSLDDCSISPFQDERSTDDTTTRELFDELYVVLKQIAQQWMGRQRRGHTLQATALAHDAFLKLDRVERKWKSRGHFLRTASKAMLQVLVDHEKKRRSAKRTRPALPTEAEIAVDLENDLVIDVLTVRDLLEEMKSRSDESMITFIELRFFGGATMSECSELLEVPLRTLERRWRSVARWMKGMLEEGYGGSAASARDGEDGLG